MKNTYHVIFTAAKGHMEFPKTQQGLLAMSRFITSPACQGLGRAKIHDLAETTHKKVITK